MRAPVFINQYIRMAPDNRMYVETPFNESLFPASNLTYDRVKITSNKTNLAVLLQVTRLLRAIPRKIIRINRHYKIGRQPEKKTNFLAAFAMSVLGVPSFTTTLLFHKDHRSR